MPELPEVETTRRGISPHVLGRKVQKVVVRESRLRWPVPEQLSQALSGARITAVNRRAKDNCEDAECHVYDSHVLRLDSFEEDR